MISKTLAQLYAEHQGKVSDKWSLYLEEYDRIFGSSRDKPVKLLEIGVQNGGALEIWSKYFPKGEKFIGCDINPECSRLRYDESRVEVVIGDANSDNVQTEILKHSPEFDIVIDDGSHVSGDIVKSFARYFPNITDGGVFVAEDLHCSYWKDFEGGLFYPFSAITFFKHLADVINHEHWGVPKNSSELLTGFFEKYGFRLDEDTLDQVHSIEFVNSICIVRKCAKQSNVLGSRFIAGDIEEIVAGHDKIQGKPLEIPPQSHNFWSSRELPPSEELPLRLEELDSRSEQIDHLNQAVAEREGLIAHLNQTVAERESELQQVLASTSWRVTRPIRAIKSYFLNTTFDNDSK